MLVRVELRLPITDPHDHAAIDYGRVADEVAEAHGHRDRRGIDVSQAGLVRSVDVIARLLELDREKEGGRSIHARRIDAGEIVAATGDVVGPETETGRIGFAQEEVVILLAHKVRCVIDWVRDRLNQIVVDRQGRRRE